MSESNESKGRVLARVLADDLKQVTGGTPEPERDSTSTVTGSPTGNLNGSDITNTGGDAD